MDQKQVITCPRCLYTTESQTIFKRHLMRKNPCKPVASDLDIVNFRAEYEFSCSPNAAFKELIKRVAVLENNARPPQASLDPIAFQQDTQRSETDQVRPFGRERRDVLFRDFILMDACLKRPVESLAKFIDKLFFNDEFPENMNIRVTNVRLPYVQTYNGQKWIYDDTDDVIAQITATYMDAMDAHAEFGNSETETYEAFCHRFDAADPKLNHLIRQSIIEALRRHIPVRV